MPVKEKLMKLGNRIKEAREAKQLTQNELVKLSGVSRASLQLYEADKGNITLDNLEKIANALNIDISFFVSPSNVSKSSENVSYLSPTLSLSSKKSVPKTQNSPQTLKANSYYTIPRLNLIAQAGGGNEVLDLECYESGEVLTIDKAFFKAVPGNKLKAIRVEGYSMIPMLMPDSWVVFEDNRNYKGDGLYIINYAGQLMVKLLQLDPAQKILDIISVNKEYKSYSVALAESQAEVIIVGKVLRCII